ncbi:UDP-glucose--hexose-1-phosphate uridylyltransferase [Lentibacillus sp. JNUCC-1]|uniref:UDP-glucose--hexose-1-phosphate uridylyltransferase n=1 Tax=Lentibacillus sp. JNUCC-1 TaxID=2654513 RepID=UPI0012E71A12|nr:UDP-glucose--hexose-1-phosphate uridylyltransferase [Lentibacillus sp. JNUCC-1]MUV36880.1 UDP-glucose--hexose-1-phosphate uridylyltransferase [Lentibacillus sp. JNUCC-1]
MTIYALIAGLVQQAEQAGLIEARDAIYARNRVLDRLQLDDFPETVANSESAPIPDLLDNIIAWAIEIGMTEDVLDDKEKLSADIMNCFLAPPSVITHNFYQKYERDPIAATDYFYHLSQNSNYIQTKRIKKNIHFKAESEYGVMDITINLSKPEKDPEQIKREREQKTDTSYPLCLLCKENEGYGGRTGHPPRANHRIVPMMLSGETWFLQYSPYVYYNEHSIVLAGEHRPMKINRDAFGRLVEFTEQFQHYFIGSNADLPIVGGSILSHDHYQGGRYEFAMTRAEDAFQFDLNDFPEVEASVLKWPMSVIRLRAQDTESLLDAAEHIRQTWTEYSDEACDVIAKTGNTPHNTITPIARRRGNAYELDLVLRNNRTSDAHPLGIFHPHQDVQHIKKENIGLIEVMGLAVLPARLKDELEEIKSFLLGHRDSVSAIHQPWADELKAAYPAVTSEKEADNIIEKELGRKFVRVLEDAGVLKDEPAFQRFIETINA